MCRVWLWKFTHVHPSVSPDALRSRHGSHHLRRHRDARAVCCAASSKPSGAMSWAPARGSAGGPNVTRPSRAEPPRCRPSRAAAVAGRRAEPQAEPSRPSRRLHRRRAVPQSLPRRAAGRAYPGRAAGRAAAVDNEGFKFRRVSE